MFTNADGDGDAATNEPVSGYRKVTQEELKKKLGEGFKSTEVMRCLGDSWKKLELAAKEKDRGEE